MKSFLLLVQLIVLTSSISAAPAELERKNQNTLVLLHVLFRHGNRAPDKVSLFPNDLHLNETYEPYGYSQLTLKGKQTEYEIGQYIRRHYGKLIPDQYIPNLVYALATNFKRTKMSLQLVLASLFPPLETEQIDNDLNWQPIPFNIDTGSIINVASSYCANYISQYYSYLLSQDAKNIIASYQPLYDRLSKDAGFDVITPTDAGNIYFTLKSEDDYGLKLPAWSADVYPKVLEEASSVLYEFSTATSSLKKLSAGFLLRKILQDSIALQNGTSSGDTKVFLYSAHEWNVGTMLRALNVFYRHVPPFGATIYFEIHNIKGVYGLRLFYQNYEKNNPIQLTIPGCDEFCPLDQVAELLKDSIPGDSDVCSYSDELM